MERKVVVSKTAERKLDQLFDYLVQNWSVKVKLDFIRKLDKVISILRTHPESFPASEREKGLRKCVVTKHTSLYFRFDEKEIKILTVFDSRQDPEKLNAELPKD